MDLDSLNPLILRSIDQDGQLQTASPAQTVYQHHSRVIQALDDSRGVHDMNQQNQSNQPQQGNKPGQPNPMPNKPGQSSQQTSGGQHDQSTNKK
jgi:hypothetical protein